MLKISKPEYGKIAKLLVFGAGAAGRLLVTFLRSNPQLKYEVLAYVDDDRSKIGQVFEGVPVMGNIDNLPRIIEETKPTEIVIAVPSASGKLVRSILQKCVASKTAIKILPSDYESTISLEAGRPLFYPIRELRVEDMFRRKPVVLDYQELKNHYQGKRILITGAAGSIGSELARQILEFKPSELLVLDHAETSLHNVLLELNPKKKDCKLVPIIANICNYSRMKKIIKLNKPEIVFHAAAYKHVPMMEYNPEEAVSNNIFGTKNVIDLSDEFLVKEFILISTDKAVDPTSVMGASKRVSEMIMKLKAENSQTIFKAVRFGNVINSQGSVVPLFTEQIIKGGPLTVTHKEVERFFMTIFEAVQLVLQVPMLGGAGNIFSLDMGEQYKILNLAEDMILINGFEPYKDIRIDFTGLRPGEKLSEKLFFDDEEISNTRNKRIHLIKTSTLGDEKLSQELFDLSRLLDIDMDSKERIAVRLKEIASLPNNVIKTVREGTLNG